MFKLNKDITDIVRGVISIDEDKVVEILRSLGMNATRQPRSDESEFDDAELIITSANYYYIIWEL